jgi:hypothetical protein
MLPGPLYVYECPNCGTLLTQRSLMSGNTFDQKIFSDGKRIARMLPEYPNLTKCKKCNTIFWLSKLKEIGTYEWGDDSNLEWRDADKAKFLEIDDYYIALKTGIAESVEEELFIRQRIWWAYNDRIRNGQKIFIDENDELHWKENVNKLMTLLDRSDIKQRLMIAEINRNLGDFENCISIIQSIDTDDLNWLKEKYVTECERKNKWVIELKKTDGENISHNRTSGPLIQQFFKFWRNLFVDSE